MCLQTCRWVGGFVLAGAAGLWLAGCDAGTERPGRLRAVSPGEFAGRRLPQVSLDEVREQAGRVFQQYFRIDPSASGEDVLVSRPTELSEYRATERVRDVLGGPVRHRYLATLRLTRDGSDVLVQCQVRLQRLDTAERAAFARERGDDRPTDTPIERAGASASAVREEWVTVGRDRKLEQGILDQIAEPFIGTQPAP